LLSAEIADPRREAASLLCFALGKDRAFLIAHPEYELNRNEAELFDSVVKRRASREPFHHITGVKEFYGLDFVVSPDVLIPRPETEMLVAKSIHILSQMDKSVFCEIGAGSGCIAISILLHVSFATAVGLDISEAAVAIANRNATNHDVQERLRLLHSDIFSGLKNQGFDLIVSNPPYIPVEDIAGLQPEVRDFEPHLALTDGAGGLSVIEKIVRESPGFLKSGSPLVMEIGIGQAGVVRAMFDPDLWQSVEIVSDFQAIPRMVCAVLG
jgi:release factor glutamine methyltransferase